MLTETRNPLTGEQSQVFDFAVSPVEASPSLVLRGSVASLWKWHKRFLGLIPRSSESGLHWLLFQEHHGEMWQQASSSLCREQAGGNQGAQEAFQDEKAEAKAAPDVKISTQTTISSLASPPATSADGVTVSDPHPPNLWLLDPRSQLGQSPDLIKGWGTKLMSVHCSGRVSGPAPMRNWHLPWRDWWELTFPPHPPILTAV